ncbi:MAG: SprT-like domain-containing protein [Candidatus Muirbacterium halophilum]|nr:SprT-like domain-containing protein [Candidatus Muirbacterium halophilum]
MINLELFTKIKNETFDILSSLNIPVSKKIVFEFNENYIKTYGSTEYFKGGYKIVLSTLLFKSEKELKNTLIHECLHTCPNCMNHGKTWKKYAEKINSNLNYNIKRCTDVNELEKSLKEEIIKRQKYCVECCNCGQKSFFMRKCKSVNYPNLYKCKCGGELKSYELKGI